ncbi:MAG: hypothetical protein M9962_11080 [Oligoflexia bacterium]|nr:hypothetical protein [Oligoflexia bacterium]
MEMKKVQKHIERVTINDHLKEKLQRLTNQANASLDGIAHISKSDVVNLILENFKEAFSSAEIDQLRSIHIDQVKLAIWLAKEMRNAKKSGANITVKELLNKCELTTKPKVRASTRTKKEKQEPISQEEDPKL